MKKKIQNGIHVSKHFQKPLKTRVIHYKILAQMIEKPFIKQNKSFFSIQK